MKKILFSKLILLSILFSLVSMASINAQCSISPGNVTLDVGETTTLTAASGQSYYWTVSGPATINGSNTGQSISITATGTGNIQVCVTVFDGGNCYDCCTTVKCNPCGITIIELVPMCWSPTANCYVRRGDFTARDCHGNPVAVDWDVSPKGGPNALCMNLGCNTPFIQRKYSTTVEPVPMCPWTNLNVTIYAYEHGTNNLLATYVATIETCPSGPKGSVFGLKTQTIETNSDPTVDLEVLNNRPGATKSVKVKTTEQMNLTISAVHITTGEEVVISHMKDQEAGTYSMEVPTDKLREQAMYLIVARSGNKILGKAKLLNF